MSPGFRKGPGRRPVAANAGHTPVIDANADWSGATGSAAERTRGIPLNPSAIYLDNAATSWPKPPGVVAALEHFYRRQGRAAGRGAYSGSLLSGTIVDNCRKAVRELFQAGSPDAVVLAHNGTDALNLAVFGMLRPGDRVLCSPLEHNSLLRPLYACRDSMGVRLEWLPLDATGRITPASVSASLRDPARMVCLTHGSNVSGIVQDVGAIGAACRAAETFFLVDASQTAGRWPVDVSGMQIDLLAAAGHKGLFGPLGTGILVVGPRAAPEIRPTRFGGTGRDSEQTGQPRDLPARLECGNHDVGNLAALAAGIDFVRRTGIDQIQSHEQALERRLRDLLADRSDLAWLAPPGQESGDRIAVGSLVFADRDPHEIAFILDASFGIEVRTGLHCAPLAARAHCVAAGQATVRGKESDPAAPLPTLRISPGWYNTMEDIERTAAAIGGILDS